VAHLGPHLVGVGLEAAAGGEGVEERALDEAPAGVVGAEPAPGLAHDALALGHRQPQDGQAEADLEPVPERPLAVAHGAPHHLDHAVVALDPGGEAVVPTAHVALGDQVGQDRELDARLAERRQHLLDVAQEQPVGPDHQHALALEGEAVGVQQVGGPVQGDHGLARARSPLDDEDAGERGADDLVLLALDGGDDVAEASGPGGLQRGDEGAVTGDGAVGLLAVHALELAEDLVLHGQQGPAAGGEVPAPAQAHRLAARGAVEGLGDRRPPVDHERLLVLVGHGQAPDVERLAPGLGGAVDATEHQGGIAELELAQALEDVLLEDLTLPAGLLGAAPAHLEGVLETRGGAAVRLEALVGVVDVGLFGLELGMAGHGGFAILPAALDPADGGRADGGGRRQRFFNIPNTPRTTVLIIDRPSRLRR